MKNWFINLRDSIVPPYCYAKACIGKSKTEIKSRYKKAEFAELPNGLHPRFEFRIFRSTITCDIKHGVCLSATLVPDNGENYITYRLNEKAAKIEKIEVQEIPPSPRNVGYLGDEARGRYEQERPRRD